MYKLQKLEIIMNVEHEEKPARKKTKPDSISEQTYIHKQPVALTLLLSASVVGWLVLCVVNGC